MSRPTRCAPRSLPWPARSTGPTRRPRLLLRMGLALVLGLATSLAIASAAPPPAGVGSNPAREPVATPAQAQTPATQGTAASVTPQPSEPAALSADQAGSRVMATVREEVLSLAILFFGLVVLIVQYLLLRSPRRSSFEILQLLAINLIVTGTLFLISAGYGADQIAPGLGLFGTVAGYVLGRRSSDPPPGDRPETHAPGSR